MLKDPKNILAIRFGLVGDVLLTVPALKAVKETYPNAYLVFMAEPRSYEVVSGNPYFDEIIICDRDNEQGLTRIQRIKEEWKLIRRLRGYKFDLAIDLYGGSRSALYSFLSGAKLRLGYAGRQHSFLYNIKVNPQRPPMHSVDYYLNIISLLGIRTKDKSLAMYIPKEDEEFATEFLRKQEISFKDLLIGMFPDAGWPPKRWPPENFVELANRLYKKYRARVILFGGKRDVELVEKVANKVEGRPIVAAGRVNLKQLAALIKRCTIFISNDTGPMHIAVAVKTPTIGIFGPTDPRVTGPYGEEHIVVRKDIDCAPCLTRGCEEHTCMKLVTVEDVLEAVEKKLKGTIKRGGKGNKEG